MMKHWFERLSEKLWMALAWAMPSQLVYWCSVRLVAKATTGRFSHTNVPSLTAIDALTRWEQQ